LFKLALDIIIDENFVQDKFKLTKEKKHTYTKSSTGADIAQSASPLRARRAAKPVDSHVEYLTRSPKKD
jgi:hypothetical protein